jgi:hypothetical protein
VNRVVPAVVRAGDGARLFVQQGLHVPQPPRQLCRKQRVREHPGGVLEGGSGDDGVRHSRRGGVGVGLFIQICADLNLYEFDYAGGHSSPKE